MSTLLPDFQKDVTGEYLGNAYAEPRDYRVHIEQITPGDRFRLWVEDSGGNQVGEYVFSDEVAEDGVMEMASRNHGLDGYEDDWHLPDGMYRTLGWVLPTNNEVDVRLDEDTITEVANWLRFALGFAEYDGPSDRWEY